MKFNKLQFFIGSWIISWHIWSRPFSVIEPRVFINDLGYNLPLLIISLIVVLAITGIYKLYYPTQKENIYEKLKIDKIIIMLQEAPSYVYEKLTKGRSLLWLKRPTSYFTAYLAYPRAFVIMFFYLPQLIVATTFAAETIFFDQTVVFIKTLNLLIIFLFCKTMIFTFKRYSMRRITHYELYLDIVKDDTGIQFALRSPREMPPSPPGLKMGEIIRVYHTMCQFWVVYQTIYRYMYAIEEYNQKYSSYVRIYVFICYLIGWAYLLLRILPS